MDNALHLEANSQIAWHPEQLATEVDGEVIVMGLVQGKYVGFDEIASIVWRRLERKQSLSELCDGLVRDFEGDREIIRQDIVALLRRLDELGLITVETGRD